MAILKTRWSKPVPKKEEVKIPEKKVKIIPAVEKPVITEETTAEEIIATLPKKQRGTKKVNIEE